MVACAQCRFSLAPETSLQAACGVINSAVPNYPHYAQRLSSLCSKYLVICERDIINSTLSACKINNFCPKRLFFAAKNAVDRRLTLC